MNARDGKNVLLMLAVCLMTGCGGGGNGSGTPRPPESGVREVIVKYARSADVPRVAARLALQGVKQASVSEMGGFQTVTVPEGWTAEELAEYLSEVAEVEYAEPDYIAYANYDYEPSDPLLVHQWNFPAIGVREAWDTVGGGDSSIVVAVVDTGVAYENYGAYKQATDLLWTQFVPGYDFIFSDLHANDDHGHGTHVAGTIAQSTDNNFGTAGIAHDVTILPVKVLGPDGSGPYSAIANGIYYAVNSGADIVNLSLGGVYASLTLQNALKYADLHEVVVVASVGNDATSIEYPARYNEYCISVGGVDSSSVLGDYSNRGPELDLVAPGGGGGSGVLQQTLLNGAIDAFAFESWVGTSMAAAHVSGAAALLMSAGADGPQEIESILRSTALDLGGLGWDQLYGSGLIQVDKAIAEVVGTVPPPDPEPQPDPGTESILDDGDLGTSYYGTWQDSSVGGAYDGDSLYCRGYAAEWYRWVPDLPTSGRYAVYQWWTEASFRSNAVPVRVVHGDGEWSNTLNQQEDGAQWNYLGEWDFPAGRNGFVEISGDGGQASADAVRFVLVESADPPPVVNSPPIAEDDLATVAEDSQVDVDVLANDSDPDGDPLELTTLTQPGNGTVAELADGWVRYQPDLNYNGEDSFTYSLTDGNGVAANATVLMTVTPVNDPPTAVDDEASTEEDLAVDIDVLANDQDIDADPLHVHAFSQPGNGQVARNADDTFRYFPSVGFSGTDSFTYQVADSSLELDTATVVVVVTPKEEEPPPEPEPPPVPDVEVILDDGDTGTSEEGYWRLSGVGGGYDGDSLYCRGYPTDRYRWTPVLPDELTYAVYIWWTAAPFRSMAVPVVVHHAEGEWSGTLNQQEYGGEWVYLGEWPFGAGSVGFVEITGAGGQASADAVRFVATGGGSDPDPVPEENVPPVAVDDVSSTPQGVAVDIPVLDNDSDADGDVLAVAGFSQPANGTVMLNVNGTLRYQPDAAFFGLDGFTYQVGDGQDGFDEAHVSVTVVKANEPPVAVDDSAETSAGEPVDIDVLANDHDPDGDPLFVESATDGIFGHTTLNVDGSIRYVPDSGFQGTDFFTYVVADPDGASDEASVSLSIAAGPVEPPEEPPPAGVDVIVDDREPGTSYYGYWRSSSVAGGYDGDSLYCRGNLGEWYRWAPDLPAVGVYQVYIWWTAANFRSDSVPVVVKHRDGEWTSTLNQQQSGSTWVSLGEFTFAAGSGGYVEISGAGGQASADAVRFVSVP